MSQGRIVIITGSPGTGKTTVSELLAQQSMYQKSVCITADDFYHWLKKGYIPPYLKESDSQNRMVITVIAQTALSFSEKGYDVILDGIFGPWFLDIFNSVIQRKTDLYYFILRITEDEALRRAGQRDGQASASVVKAMWGQFENLGLYENYALDISSETPQETCSCLRDKLESKENLLFPKH